MKGKKSRILAFGAVLIATLAFAFGMSVPAFAAADEEPDHAKILKINDDGTYTIALNVTGDSVKQIQKVNVIVIVDRSGSMGEDSGTTSVTYTATNSTSTGLYGLIDGEYVPLERRGGYGNRTFWYNGVRYTGQRYLRTEANQTRMQATQQAVNSLADGLLSYNGQDGNPNDTVEMALVSFSTTAQTNVSKTTSYNTFSNAVNNLNANGGTNWEAALQQANNINFGDNDPTYVIFFSDGSPTFHSTNGGYNNWNSTYRVYGTGGETEPNMEHSYTQAVDDAQTLANKVGVNNFYTIFAYGTTAGSTYMTNLTTAAGAPASNNYSASNTAALQEAFAQILGNIERAGIGSVEITDGTTSSVTTTSGTVSHLLTVDTDSYQYYRAGGDYSDISTYNPAQGNYGVEWEGAPEATFENSAVQWNLGDGYVLENDVTYTVTFNCWPSQTTLDIVADIKNDPTAYDRLDKNIKDYIDSDGNLKTNTEASISWVDTRTGHSGNDEFEPIPAVSSEAVEELALSKQWENALDGREAEPITLTVTRDGTDTYTVTLGNPDPQTGDPDWSDSVYISIGILRHTSDGELTDSAGRKYEVLENGHNFTFVEPMDLGYYWELEVPVVRPMMIDGTLTMLIKKEGRFNNPDNTTEYTIGGSVYYVGDTGAASLTAINHRRAQLNLTKAVDGEDADPDQKFPFTLNVVDSKASSDSSNPDNTIWFSVWNGGYVDADVSGAEKEYKNGAWTGFYYAPSGSNVTLNLKAGDNLRILNLPIDSTYTFTEGTLPDNYAYVNTTISAKTWDDDENEIPVEVPGTAFSGGQTTTGTIHASNIDYTVTFNNKYDLAAAEITKVWDDGNNQDGKRPTVDQYKSYLKLYADGTDVTSRYADKLTVTVDPTDSNKYLVKWSELDRYADGKDIVYTIEETPVPTDYTCTQTTVPDRGTITNTHTPEATTATVTKVWEDSDNRAGKRPASIQVQLYANGTAEGDPVTLPADGAWTYTWNDLPKYSNGTEIVYTADETAVPSGYTKTGPVTENGTSTITNTLESGDLTVSKTVVSDATADHSADFSFTVTLSDTSISGTFGDVTFASGVATFTLKDGGSKSITGLPAGITYTVAEATATGFTTTKTGDTGSITKDATATAAFTNTRQTGNLNVTKTVVSNTSADLQKDFNFTVTLSDTTINKTFGDVTFTNGVATFTLKDGGSKAITGLPTGITYTVTEDTAAGFVTTKTNDTGTISTTPATAAFTNTREQGTLELNKTVVSQAAADANKTFTFTVTLNDTSVSGTYGDMTFSGGVATVTLKGGEKATAPNLPAGVTYTITEATATGFTTESTGASGTIPKDSTASATFTNTREVGNLTVTKSVVSDNSADKDIEFNFTVTLSDNTINGTFGEGANAMTFTNGVAQFKLKDGQSITATGLPTEITYEVVETTDNGFTTSYSGEEGTISTTASTATVTNTRKTGELEVTKTVNSHTAADKQKEFTFTVTLDDNTINKTYSGLEFTNGVATFTLKDGGSKTISGLPQGIGYTVTETAVSGFETVPPGGASGEISATTSTAAFTNSRDEGGLIVSKTVVSDITADHSKPFTFTITLGDTSINETYDGVTFENGVATVTLTDGGSKSITGLPTGITYEVVETADADFTTSKTGDTGTIATEASTAAFINTCKVGELNITKTVVSDAAADKDLAFDFTITLTNGSQKVSGTYSGITFDENGQGTIALKSGESKKIDGLPIGTSYTVVEATAEGFTTEKTGDTGSISTTASTAAFTNTRETGDLELTKTVVSDAAADANQEFTFTVTLSDTSITKTYGDMAFTNGAATVTLKGGETATATGLPTDITYTITEAAVAGFTNTAKVGDTGTISTTKSSASFTNTRQTGNLSLTKTVVSDKAADKDVTFTFTVTLSDTTISKTYGDMAFTNGVATVTLKHGETAEATGLPTGITYTITEATADGFTLSGKTGDTGTISTTASEATFTNTRETGNLKVTKDVVSDAAADKTKDFSFTVTLSDTTISGTYGDATFADGVATFTLKDGESVSITGLPTDITYTVVEAAETGFQTSKTGDEGTIVKSGSTAAFTNTRDKGDLEITKTVESDKAADANVDFTFTVSLSDKTITGTFGDMTFADGVAEITLKDGGKASITGLPTDVSYTVTEANADGFTTTFTGNSGTISTTKSTAAFTNTRQTGDLTVNKTLVSDLAADADQAFTITVTLDDTSINGTYGEMAFTNGVATLSLKGGESATATGLPTTVEYAITEAAVSGFTTESEGATGTITTTKSEAEFTNTREVGDLTVSKSVTSTTTADHSRDFSFKVTLSDTSISGTFGDMTFTNGVAEFTLKDTESVTAEGLPTTVGYTVEETAVDGFDTSKTGDTGNISTTASTAAFSNVKKEGGLTVEKTVVSDKAADADVEFEFTVTLSDTSISGEYGGMTFSGGKATFKLKGGQSKAATGLPDGVEYTVVEAAADGFQTTESGDTGSIVEDKVAQVSFTNTRETGDLELSKVLVSDLAADADQVFTFTVTLDDTTISGTYGEMAFANGVATVTLKGGEKATATGLPTSVGYTITEAAVDGIQNTEKTGDTGTISTTKSSATFTNTRETGDLEVTKTVVSDKAADADVEFEFTVTLSDTSISGTFGGMTFADGVATFKLKGGESAKATGLPTTVTYTVAETAADGFTTTPDEPATGTITTTASTAAFTNTRETGKLTVEKSLDSDLAADADQEFTIKVTLDDTTISGTYGNMAFSGGVATLTLKGGQSAEATGLPTSVGYTVEETTADGFTTTYNGETGTISTTAATATVTNTRETGSLEVEKTVESDKAADANVEFSFTVTLGDTTINGEYGGMTFADGVATFTLKGGESVKATGLPTTVTYTVVETADNGFTTEKTGDTGSITTDGATAEFTNTRKTGDLEVTKTVVSSTTADKQKEFTFTITLDDNTIEGAYGDATFTAGKATVTLKDGETAAITGLPQSVGYTVEETAVDGFVTTQTGDEGTISADKSTAAFTNTRDEGGLIVSKKVESDIEADHSKQFTFTITLSDTSINETYGEGDAAVTFTNGVATITLKDGDTANISGLPTGIEYTVEETADTDFTTEPERATGTISSTASNAAFTNTRKVNDLTVSKTVVSDKAADADQEFTFTITLTNGNQKLSGTYSEVTFDENGQATITLKGGESKTFEDLPIGTSYTVVETEVEGFDLTSKTGDTGTIAEDAASTAAFTNTRETGDIELSKVLVSDLAADADQEFTFTVTLGDDSISGKYGDMTFANGVATVTLKGGESAKAEGLPTTVTYTITEAEAEGFTLTGKTGDEGTISTTASEAQFTNTRETGDLEVTKTVKSDKADDANVEFEFTVTLGDTSISGTYGDMKFTDGVATFKLKTGEKATAEGLPATVSYTVAETAVDGFTTTKTGDSGNISTELSTAAFTNTRETSGLKVEKVLESDLAADKDQKFTITVTLGDDSITGEYGDMNFENGVATVELKGGESAEATGLPTSVTYSVEETAVDGLTVTYEGKTGTITTTTAEATVTNTRQTGDLELTKVLESDLAADANVKFEFTVTLSDTTINGEYGDATFTNGVATVELKGGESASITGLPTTVEYAITETEVDGIELTAKTGDTGEISTTKSEAEFTNTRETGDLELTKIVESSTTADKTKAFTFTITLSDKTINGKYGDATFAAGVATVELEHGQTASITGLPTTVEYTIEETADTAFTTEAEGDTGTISKDAVAKAEFTNSKKEGDLTVSKTVKSDLAADADVEFEFTVTLSDKTLSDTYGGMEFTNGVATFKLKGGQSVKAEGLPDGVTYTVVEAETDGFQTTESGDTGSIVADDIAQVSFTNTREVGDLEVTKTVDSVLESDSDVEFEFTVTLSDTTINGEYGDMTFTNGVATFTLKDGDKASATGLPTDVEFTVEETANAAFTTEAEGDTGTVSTELSTAAFTNTRDTTSISGEKVWEDDIYFEGDAAELGDANEYARPNVEITLTGSDGNTYTVTLDGEVDETIPNKASGYESGEWEYTFVNLPKTDITTGEPLTYEASEAELTGWTDSVDGTTVTNTPDDEKVVNDDEATLTIKKVDSITGNVIAVEGVEFTLTPTEGTEGEAKTYTTDANGTITISFSGDETTAVNVAKTGTYTLEETGAPEGYTASSQTYTVTVNEELVSISLNSEGLWEWLYNLIVAADPDFEDGVLTVPNTPDLTDVTAKKVWNDNSNKDNKRPDDVTFQLYKTVNGTKTAVEGKTATLSGEGNEWTTTFTNLPEYEDGYKVTYSVDEVEVPEGYTKSNTDDLTITNSYQSEPVKEVFTGTSTTTIDGEVVQPGQELTYQITYINTTGKTAKTVTITDEIPAHTTLVDESISDGGTESNGTITWSFTNVANGAEKVVSFKVTVDDDVDGEVLKNKSVVNDGENSYNSNETTNPTPPDVPSSPTGEGNLTVTKELTGRALKAGEFSFTLTPVGSAPGSKQTKTNAADGTVSFDEISFIKTGTFEYTIDEVEGDLGGVTYDESTYTAVATVTQDDNDPTKLIVEWSIEGSNSDEIVFENVYQAEGDVELAVTKSLAGAAWPKDGDEARELTLTLSGTGGTLPETKTVKLTAEGDATFGAIEYTEADAGKEYTYTISEGNGFGSGWDGSGDVTATVMVTDNGDGTMSTDVTYSTANDDGTAAAFTNTYKAEGEAVLEINKSVAGAAWPANKTLTFTLSGEGGTLPDPATVTMTEPGKAEFGAIKYTEADMGKTYTYTISENGFGDGWTGSGDVTATVVVTDNGDGTLDTEITYSSDDVITNTYKAEGHVTLQASKELVGREWKSGESFTFELVDEQTGATLDTKSVSSNGSINFATIDYDEYDAGKEFEYTIREIGELPGGVAKSDSITATVIVTDNGDGTLATSVSYTNSDKIVNTYTAVSTQATISVKKTISGFISGEDPYGNVLDGTFTVEMTPVDGAPMPEGKDKLTAEIHTSGGTGTGSFDEIEYKFDDMKDESGKQLTTKQFTYNVVETGTAPTGWAYDKQTYQVVVTVEDDQNGKLKVTDVTKVDDTTNVEITNTFTETSVDVTLHVDKVIDDQSDSAQDATFTFKLTPVGDAPGGTQTIEIRTDGLQGGKDFAAITFDKAGTYEYTIQEQLEGEAPDGWTYDTSEHKIKIVVNDNFEAAILEDTTTVDGDESYSLTITNIYKAFETSANLEVTKEINDVSGSADYGTEFTFTLTSIDGAPMPGDATSVTATVTGEGTASFGDITYKKQGTYNYTIQETSGGNTEAGWVNDQTAYSVVVSVIDKGGHLVASVAYGENQDTSLTVTNKYEPQPAKYALSARKVVKADPEEGHAPDASFTFVLTPQSGAPGEVERVTIQNGGVVDFSEIEYAQVGTYSYTIQEMGEAPTGWTYDNAAHNVTVTVSDPGDGQLKAMASYDDSDELVITNTFTVDPVWIDPPVKKVVKGNPQTDETFTFQMKALTEGAPMPAGSDGNVKTMTITGSGEKEFGRVDFYAAGTYTYQISEVAGSAKGYTYDNTVYTITVEVTENEDGSLSKTETITGGDGKIVFTNEYKATPGKKKMPKTGDSNPLGLVAVLLGLGGTALVAAGASRRRERQ